MSGSSLDSSPVPDHSVDAMDSVIATAAASHASLQSSAYSCDGPCLSRLEANTASATSQATTAAADVVGAVRQSVAAFASSARRRMRMIDKYCDMCEDELRDKVSALEAYLQLLDASDFASITCLEDTMHNIRTFGNDASAFPGLSMVISGRSDGNVRALSDASLRIQSCVDVSRSKVSHARWLTRGDCNNAVTITVVDDCGCPVSGMDPTDVVCSFLSEAVGWRVTAASVEASTVKLNIELTPDCSSSVMLCVYIGTDGKTLHLKAAASPTQEEDAMIACEQVIAIRGVVSVHHAAELVAACASALSSPALAEYFVTAVYICCLHGEANIDTCADAGVVPGLAAAMLSHGADCVGVAAQGCQSLAMLASRSTASADTLVLTDGGLVAILHVLESHARHEKVLRYACMSLFDIASACSPVARSALRASRVSELLLAAKATYPLDGEWTVKSWADLALAALRNADDA